MTKAAQNKKGELARDQGLYYTTNIIILAALSLCDILIHFVKKNTLAMAKIACVKAWHNHIFISKFIYLRSLYHCILDNTYASQISHFFMWSYVLVAFKWIEIYCW